MKGYTLKVLFCGVMAGLLTGCATSVDDLLIHYNPDSALEKADGQGLLLGEKQLR